MKIVKFNYKKFINQIFIALGALLLVAFIFAYFNSAFEKPKVITLSELVSKINSGEVSKIVVRNDDLNIILKDNSNYSAKKEIEGSLTETLKNYGVDSSKLQEINLQVEQNVGLSFWIGSILPMILPFLFGWVSDLVYDAAGKSFQCFGFWFWQIPGAAFWSL